MQNRKTKSCCWASVAMPKDPPPLDLAEPLDKAAVPHKANSVGQGKSPSAPTGSCIMLEARSQTFRPTFTSLTYLYAWSSVATARIVTKLQELRIVTKNAFLFVWVARAHWPLQIYQESSFGMYVPMIFMHSGHLVAKAKHHPMC